MRRSHAHRTAVLLVAALGLWMPAVPAPAATTSVMTFQGTASLSGGLGYPCFATATLDPTMCPIPAVWALAPPGKTVTVTGPITRGFSFSSSVCIAASSTVTSSENSAGAGLCSLAAWGFITGSCDLASGLGFYIQKEDKTIVLALPTTAAITLLTVRQGTFHFVVINKKLVLTGDVTATGGQWSALVMLVEVPTQNGTTFDNACAGMTADEFTLRGDAAFVEP